MKKGKPIVRLGRKAMDLQDKDCQVAIILILDKDLVSDGKSALGLFFYVNFPMSRVSRTIENM